MAGTEPAVLVGYDVELSQLGLLIDRIGIRGGALVLRGEAGIGKTALLHAANERAQARGAAVVVVTGTPSESRMPFGALHQLLGPLHGVVALLPKPQRRALDVALGVVDGETPDLFLVGLASLGVLTESAAKTPLVVLVEDAHWLDRSSAAVMGFVGRRLEMEGVVLIAASRDGTRSPFDDAGLPELHLTGLDEENARSLLNLSGVRLPEALEDRVLADAAGNPLALIELPAAIQRLEPKPTDPLPLTARLEAAFASRLVDLAADLQLLLLLAALEDAELGEVNRAASTILHSPVALERWQTIEAFGLGWVKAGRFHFRHPLVASAVRQAATDEQTRSAHTALAWAFAADADRAAWHQAAASTEPDEAIAAALEVAADRAVYRGSLDTAVTALERAAGLTPDPAQRAERLYCAARHALDVGTAERSVALLREALRIGLRPLETARASYLLETMSSTYPGAAVIPRFVELAKAMAVGGDHRGALDGLDAVAIRAYFGPTNDDVRQHAASLVDDLDVPLDDPVRLAVLSLFDPVRKGRHVIEQLRLLSPHTLPDPQDTKALGQAACAVWADDLALPFLQAASDGYRADGRWVYLAQTLSHQAWSYAHLGHVREAMTAAAEAARISAETRQVRYVQAANLSHAVAAAAAGDDATATRLVAEAEAALLPMGANPLLSIVAVARGRHALAAGHAAEAWATLSRIFNPSDAAYQPFIGGWALADLTESAVLGGIPADTVRAILQQWRPVAEDTRAPHLRVQLAYADALLADDRSAQTQLRSATAFGADSWPFYTARSQLAYGRWLRRQHRDADARTPLRQAAQTFAALGHERYADRAHEELRATGERPRQRTPDAWTLLSPQELQIAQLAAEGLSNREIGERLYLSHRTIGTHLYNLFPKLGITSRAQLRSALDSTQEG